jgi:hypothetical protein
MYGDKIFKIGGSTSLRNKPRGIKTEYKEKISLGFISFNLVCRGASFLERQTNLKTWSILCQILQTSKLYFQPKCYAQLGNLKIF